MPLSMNIEFVAPTSSNQVGPSKFRKKEKKVGPSNGFKTSVLAKDTTSHTMELSSILPKQDDCPIVQSVPFNFPNTRSPYEA
jgi:hypothetical protein